MRRDTVQTRFGEVRITFDEVKDRYELWWGRENRPFSAITEEFVRRAFGTMPVGKRLLFEAALTSLAEKRLERHLKELEERRKNVEYWKAQKQRAQGDSREAEEDTDPYAEESAGEGSGQDLARPLAGWRGWRVNRAIMVPELIASAYAYAWDLSGVNKAVCLSRYAVVPHKVPGLGCNCGFWAYRSYEHMERHGPAQLEVHGVVAAGGEIENHELGWKSEYARIIALLDTQEARTFVAWYKRVNEEELPVPLLSAAECEMLAMDQGCVFAPYPPAPVLPEVCQYLVLLAPYNDKVDLYARNGLGFVFSTPEIMREQESVRLPMPAEETESRITVLLGDATVELVKTRVLFDDMTCHLWSLKTGAWERDVALSVAQKTYGSDWLERFAVS